MSGAPGPREPSPRPTRKRPLPKRPLLEQPPIDLAKLAGLALASVWLAWGVMADRNFGLVGNFILMTHEGGHPLFAILGHFMGAAGGTIMQLLVPVAFIGSFYVRGQVASAGVACHWLAASFFGASAYAADAITQELPLIHTGMSASEELETYGGTEHDWINMLEMLNLPLTAANPIAALLTLAACAAWAAGFWLGLRASGIEIPLPVRARTRG